MKYFRSRVSIRFAASTLLLALGCAMGNAWSVENPQTENNALDAFLAEAEAAPLPAPVKPAPGKLQNLTSKASELAMRMMSLLGIRYKYGGSTPESGLDCSGLVRYLFQDTSWGANLPRTAEEISRLGKKVEPAELQTGDLVFYNTLRRGFSHVGIYLGDNKFIHSPAKGGEVRIESMEVGYWRQRFNGARRLGDPE
jgi:cell wall-associated NlpC family hydrolase